MDMDDVTREREKDILEKELNKEKERKKLFEKKVQDPSQYIRDTNKEIGKIEKENNELQKVKEKLRHSIASENEKKDKEMTRLSQVASSKLRDNNPNVLDLSDENRPSRIAEKLSELYDNEWTDAYSVVETKHSGIECIQMLLKVLQDAYTECEEQAGDNHFRRIQCSIESPGCAFASDEPIVMPDLLKQQIKEYRKRRAGHVIKQIQKVVASKLRVKNADSPVIQQYVSECIEISWLMVIQDPPLVFEFRSDPVFDKNKFREYTKRGKYVDFIVWPILLLHDNGPMLSKGIAQGSNIK